MPILGNLLNKALTLIPGQYGLLYQFTGNTDNGRGQKVSTFAAPITVYGSFQAVPRNLYERMGLEFKNVYYMLFTSDEGKGLARGERGDQLEIIGKRFQIQAEGGWKPIDGWGGLLMIEVLNDG